MVSVYLVLKDLTNRDIPPAINAKKNGVANTKINAGIELDPSPSEDTITIVPIQISIAINNSKAGISGDGRATKIRCSLASAREEASVDVFDAASVLGSGLPHEKQNR